MITLSVQNLRKQIAGKEIIKDVSFDVQEGEVFGFLGPNGAGKTTTIRMLVGLIRPSSGSIKICGHEVKTDFIKAMRCIGCIVENPEVYNYLTGRENLEHFSRMLGPIDHQRITEVIQLVDLEKRIDDKVKTYSLGMRQRLGIAQALLGRPRLLILDEPTNGLDPAGIRELRTFVRKLAHEEGMSVFVSSHLLSEIQMMCDRVAIISHGKIIKTTTVEEIVQSNQTRVEWKVSDIHKALSFLEKEAEHIQVQDEETISCFLDESRLDVLNTQMVLDGIKVRAIKPIPRTLEDIFLELTGGDRIE